MRRFERRLLRLLFQSLWLAVTIPFRVLWFAFRFIFFKKQIKKDGYVVHRSPSGKERFEHRIVAQQILGRRLEHWEVVHHINGQRDDNRPSNLCVMPRAQHERYHAWYDYIRSEYGKYPRRETQLRKLRETFDGILLDDVLERRSGAS